MISKSAQSHNHKPLISKKLLTRKTPVLYSLVVKILSMKASHCARISSMIKACNNRTEKIGDDHKNVLKKDS